MLEPGDFLYLPAGTWHNAKAIGGSLALNLAFRPVGFFAILSRMLEAAFLDRPAWRGSPPPVFVEACEPGVLPDPVARYIRDCLRDLRDFAGTADVDSPAFYDTGRGSSSGSRGEGDASLRVRPEPVLSDARRFLYV